MLVQFQRFQSMVGESIALGLGQGKISWWQEHAVEAAPHGRHENRKR
jgi:hypothetical protein